MASEVGRVVGGRWEIERLLARGGMGAVWVARHRVTRELVALKVLYPDGPREDELHERLLREAAAPAQIGHPGLVRVLDAGVDPDDGSMYLAMELLEGESLRDRLARPGLTRRAALDLVVALLEPLAAAHALGFVHRDLKPQNAFVARARDGTERPKLLDFGLSRRPGVVTVTGAGNVMGTAIYTSPEQLRSARNATPAADVWSVGVMLYQILTGRLPFEGANALLFGKILSEAAPPIATLAPDVDPALAALVERCLAKDPTARPADAGVLRRELVAVLDAAPRAADTPLRMAAAPTSPVEAAAHTEDTPRTDTPPHAVDAPPPTEASAPLRAGGPSAIPSPAASPAVPLAVQPPPLLGADGTSPTMDSAITQRHARGRPVVSRRLIAVVASALAGSTIVIVLASVVGEDPPSPPGPGTVPEGTTAPPPLQVAAVGPASVSARAPAVASIDTGPATVISQPTTVDPRPDAPDVLAGEERPEPPRQAVRAQQQHPPPPPRQQQQQQQQPPPPLPPPGRPSGTNPRDCGRIVNATAARCFIDATGGSASGEYMLRNLVLAYTLLGDRSRARNLASRYFFDYGSSPFAMQIRQLGYTP